MANIIDPLGWIPYVLLNCKKVSMRRSYDYKWTTFVLYMQSIERLPDKTVKLDVHFSAVTGQ